MESSWIIKLIQCLDETYQGVFLGKHSDDADLFLYNEDVYLENLGGTKDFGDIERMERDIYYWYI